MAEVMVHTEDGTTECVPVSDYTRLDMGFEKFNPLQSRFVLEGLHVKDCNVVCTWPTSAGKTVVAELVCEVAMEEGKKVVYACPLKSLAEEKVRRLKELFPERNVEIFTGDYRDLEERREKAIRADVAIVTTELLDSASRTRLLSDVLLKNCYCVISDEAHILATDRGPALEGALIRISSTNPDIRHVLLSATVPNAEQLAEWVADLNGKKTFVLRSDWRPVQIQWHVGEVKPRYPRREWRKSALELCTKLVRDLLIQDPDTRILLFVWSKGEGRLILERLLEMGIPASFHNAELELKERLLLEERFETGEVKVLVSTTTLAWGRNTSARHVILFGEKRGPEYVDAWDVLQAGGRAGRTGRQNRGDVWFLVGDSEFAEKVLSSPPPVVSKLAEKEALAFQILGEIPYNGGRTISEIFDWFEKTFARRCIRGSAEEFLEEAILFLIQRACARISGEVVNLTALGKIARRFYVKPSEIFCIFTVLSELSRRFRFGRNPGLDLELGCVLFTAHSSAKEDVFLSKEERMLLKSEEAEQWEKRYGDCLLTEPHTFCSFMLKRWHFFHSKNTKETAHYRIREFIFDMDRISEVCAAVAEEVLLIDQVQVSAIRRAGLVLQYGAPYEAYELLTIKGIGAKRAIDLLQAGIKTRAELIDAIRRGDRALARILPVDVVQRIVEQDQAFDAFSFFNQNTLAT